LGKYRKELTEHLGYLEKNKRNYNRATGLSLAVSPSLAFRKSRY
jgi:hypothetical protein